MTDSRDPAIPKRARERTSAEAMALVEAWKVSGTSQKNWCKQNGIKISSLTSYRRRATIRSCPATNPFVELIAKQVAIPSLRLTISAAGAAVDLSPSELAQVIQSFFGRIK